MAMKITKSRKHGSRRQNTHLNPSVPMLPMYWPQRLFGLYFFFLTLSQMFLTSVFNFHDDPNRGSLGILFSYGEIGNRDCFSFTLQKLLFQQLLQREIISLSGFMIYSPHPPLNYQVYTSQSSDFFFLSMYIYTPSPFENHCEASVKINGSFCATRQ